MSNKTELKLREIEKQRLLQPAPASNLDNPIKYHHFFSRKAFVPQETHTSFGETADPTAETAQRLWSARETLLQHIRILML